MKVYDEVWGSLDVIPYDELRPVVERLRYHLNVTDTEYLRVVLSETLTPLEALLSRKE